jgi:RimJ/RimL family protein N-acetyltransferase
MNTLAKTWRDTYSSIVSMRRTPAASAAHGSFDAAQEPIATRNGRKVILRQIRADDVVALQRGFAHLTPDEVRMRFLHPLNELPREFAISLCDLDARFAVAWVLADPDAVAEPEIHAVARVHLDPVTEQAEFAIVVQQEFTGQGFGNLLMRRMIDSARQLGAVEIWGDILLDNAAMLHLCERLGFRHHLVPHNPGVQRVTLAMDMYRNV